MVDHKIPAPKTSAEMFACRKQQVFADLISDELHADRCGAMAAGGDGQPRQAHEGRGDQRHLGLQDGVEIGLGGHITMIGEGQFTRDRAEDQVPIRQKAAPKPGEARAGFERVHQPVQVDLGAMARHLGVDEIGVGVVFCVEPGKI